VSVADRFTGQTALITGGAKGIGAATAARLAAEGADVVIADFDIAAAEETAAAIGGRAVQCDVTSREQVEAAMAFAAEPDGRLDVLVTCAGIIRDNLVYRMTDDDWDAVIATHLRGTFLATQAAQAHMTQHGGGKMVLISSVSALGNRGQLNYSAAKAGIQAMTKTLAIELGRFAVNVNCVAPGFVSTAMTRQTAERIGVDFEDFQKMGAETTALRRVGEPEDIASVIAFLCSEDASYMTGQVVYVDGGRL
jgi:3-oxoacyl-[acyl-carrier protein] reductase